MREHDATPTEFKVLLATRDAFKDDVEGIIKRTPSFLKKEMGEDTENGR